MKIQIKLKFSDKVLFEGEYCSTKECIEDANLRGADLRGADLWGADLQGADLRDANLRGADLWDANLRGADLRGADLWDANLRDANLRGADLWDANLWDANLRDANLRDADLWGEKLTKAPIQILGEKYFIMEAVSKIKIGCEIHTKEKWWNFTDKEILAMDGKAGLIWWKKWKPILKKMFKEEQL